MFEHRTGLGCDFEISGDIVRSSFRGLELPGVEAVGFHALTQSDAKIVIHIQYVRETPAFHGAAPEPGCAEPARCVLDEGDDLDRVSQRLAVAEQMTCGSDNYYHAERPS
ncbi:hypothetical protein MFUR16E_12740 [Methylobacterium fujisawaense]|uniref:hypothetical protein n=1 Tax=Methylobacterium fujisawaense TaxID=107400 RepID=UPI002F2C7507